MSELTPNLGLFKYNPLTDGKEVFSINTALNNNWDILDDVVEGGDKWHTLKGYSDEGELLLDKEGLADVKNYAHSTFDEGKFEKSSDWSGTITKDGIASGFSGSNYLTKSINIDGYELSFGIKFKTNDVSSSSRQELIRSDNFVVLLGNGSSFIPRVRWGTTSDNLWATMTNQVLTANQWYIFEGELDNTSHNWKLSLYDGITLDLIQTMTGTLSGTATLPSTDITISIGKGTLSPFSGLIDLKWFFVRVDDVKVFSGNKTGTDIYTRGGSTYSIPYTLSKTGSKIVNSGFRFRVNSMYEDYGYAPYYTLDEINNNYTLPMGEIYGLMQQNFETLYQGRFSIDAGNSNFTIGSTTYNYNGFVTGTNSITIPTDGLYCITFSCQRDKNHTTERDSVRLMVNNENKYEVSTDNDYISLTGFYYIPLFEGDLIQLYGYNLATRPGWADNVITIRKINNLNIVS